MNTKRENEFYEVTLSDLLSFALKQWRKILLVGIIIALGFGLFKFIPLYYGSNGDNLNPTEVAEKKILQKTIEETKAAISKLEKEQNESIYYNLEPSLITKGFISYYVDTPIKDVDLGYERNLVACYLDYFISGEIYGQISSQLSEYIKPEYLLQIVEVEFEGRSTFTIYVLGSNEKQTNEIMKLLKQELSRKKLEFSNIVTDHTISLITENIVVVSDSKVMDDQIFQLERIEALKTKLSEKESQLQTIETAAITKFDALFIGLKFGLIGLLVGIASAIMIYFSVAVILLNKIISRQQIINNFKIDVLGEFIQEKYKRRKIDVFVSKLVGEPYDMNNEDINLVIANNIIAMAKSKKVLVAGCKDVTDTEKIFEGISSCKILKDYEISFSNKSFSHHETLENVSDVGSVIIILKRNRTSLDELQNTICTIDNYNKDFVGVILS